MNEKKHFVLTHMDSDQNRSETEAIYQGEFETDKFPVKGAYWREGFLIVPSWFSTGTDAHKYIKKVREHTPGNFYMVQERHYAKGDPRIASAKIIGAMSDVNIYPQPELGKTQERYGEPMVDVWTMWFMNRDLAEQYVTAFNAEIEAAKNIGKADGARSQS
jgi:hypothetical protein